MTTSRQWARFQCRPTTGVEPMTIAARFWIYWKGWIKITLQEGETLTLNSGGDIEEGYAYTTETYYHDGTGIHCTTEQNGADCDGRYSYTRTAYTGLEELSFCPVYDWSNPAWSDYAGNPPLLHYSPKWHRVDERNRDYSAEAMNY